MKKILVYIQSRPLLRHILLGICFILVFTYFISLMLNLFTRHGQKLEVPNFVGMSLEEAKKTAKKARMTIIVSDSLYMPKGTPGAVLDQSPGAAAGVKSGRKVFLTINSLRPKMEEIPYVAGFSLRQAKNKLESKGFEIEQLVYKSDMATNSVLSQSWNGEKITKDNKVMAELGSGVILTVGRNARDAMPIVPKVMGLSLREAKSRLWEIGFNIGELKYDRDISPEDYEKAKIYKQVPGNGLRNDYGAKVALWLTLDTKRMNDQIKDADEAALNAITDSIDEEQMLRELGIE